MPLFFDFYDKTFHACHGPEMKKAGSLPGLASVGDVYL